MQKRIGVWNPTRGLWETDSLDLFSELSEPFWETWPTWGMTRSGVAFELPMRAHRMAGSASSLLRTPAAAEAEGGPRNPLREGATMRLSDQVREEIQAGTILLPTPAAMNPNDEEDLQQWEERRQRVKLSKQNGNGFGTPLGVAVRMLNGEPMSSQSEGGSQ